MRPTRLLIPFGIRRICLGIERSRSVYLNIRRAMKHTVVIIEAYHFCQLATELHPIFCSQGEVHMKRIFLGIINVDFDVAGQLVNSLRRPKLL
jgi:hypothetical protein